jgi:hypothetical protein
MVSHKQYPASLSLNEVRNLLQLGTGSQTGDFNQAFLMKSLNGSTIRMKQGPESFPTVDWTTGYGFHQGSAGNDPASHNVGNDNHEAKDFVDEGNFGG